MSKKEYEEKIMKFRRTLISISAEDILNTPNNTELGSNIRKKMWEVMETSEPESEMNGKLRTLIGVGAILFIFIATYLIKHIL
jgi:hypothetical protein